MNKKVLITGGAGYIGSHTLLELLNKGYEVIVVDNLSNSSVKSLERVKQISNKDFNFIKSDIGDKRILKNIFSSHPDISSVIHFAGFKAVGESVSNPLKYYENNVCQTVSLLEEMEKANIRNFIFSSSATVYGDENLAPISEDSILNPINPYGMTKLIIENILNDIYISNPNWSISILRYFNPIGAHESGLIGEDMDAIPDNLLPFIFNVGLKKIDHLNIFGNDYPTKDGTGVRDYIHVTDLATAHIYALETLRKDSKNLILNLGSETGFSVLEILEKTKDILNIDIPHQIEERRKGDVAKVVSSCSLAEDILKWEKKYSSLEILIKSTWYIYNLKT